MFFIFKFSFPYISKYKTNIGLYPCEFFFCFIFLIFCCKMLDKALVTCSIGVLTQPAWDVSERPQSDLLWEIYFRDVSETSQKRWLFYDVFKTSQIHLKKDVFFVTSLRRLKNISKMMSFVWRHFSKKMSFPWRLWDVSKTSLASIFSFPKICHKNDFVWFP